MRYAPTALLCTAMTSLLLTGSMTSAGPLAGPPLFVPASPSVLSLQDEAATTQGDDEQTEAPSPADEALKPLLKRYDLLRKALQGQGGIADRDVPLIERMRDQIAAHMAAHPDHTTAMAVFIQLSIWLEDDDSVNEYFEKIVRTDLENLDIAAAWEAYVESADDQEMLEYVQTVLIELHPNDQELMARRASTLQKQGRYGEIAANLDPSALDPIDDAETLRILATAYGAEFQFEKALETLRLIPEEALTTNVVLKSSIEREIADNEANLELWKAEQEILAAEAAADDLPRVEMLTAKGRIVIELFENEAPNTVANFISLAEQGFWIGTQFHRHEPGLIVQGGDPNSRPGDPGEAGFGNPGYYIPDEHGDDNDRAHFTGRIAMAHSPRPNSAGCQFYLMLRTYAFFNGDYTVFGRVIEGMDVVRSIRPDDAILQVSVLRKRDHDYIPETIPLDGQAPPTTDTNTDDAGAGDGDDASNAGDDQRGDDGAASDDDQ